LFSQPKILLKIPPGAFRPRPKVSSALVEMKFPGPSAEMNFVRNSREPIAQKFLSFIHQCFAQKRKTLANNLKNYFAASDSPLGDIPDLLSSALIPVGARAEELTLAQFVALYRAAAATEDSPSRA
jgi:16S rRNA (adenine1518-N6/adenine1519-N6)-dimethyltransferase